MDKIYAVHIERQYNIDSPADLMTNNKVVLFSNQDKAIQYMKTEVQADFLTEMSDTLGHEVSIMDLNIQEKSIESDNGEFNYSTKLSAWITEEPVH